MNHSISLDTDAICGLLNSVRLEATRKTQALGKLQSREEKVRKGDIDKCVVDRMWNK